MSVCHTNALWRIIVSALEETVRKGKVGVCLAVIALPFHLFSYMIRSSHKFFVCKL